MRVISNLPNGVIAAGSYYPVRTSHKVWLEIGAVLEKGGAASPVQALRLCYRDAMPEDPKQALSALLWFFLGGEEPDRASNGEPLFSFSQDEALIYASFYAQYGLDLSAVQLHWWQFLALLRGLGADTPLIRTAAIRAANPADIKDSALRRRLIAQKRAVALENNAEADVAGVLGSMF